jgi:ubiquinone/menaquinone biosynthesis C-methylase UbiE
MRLGRNLTVKIRFILDELIPPILRDQYWFMALPIKFVFGKKADIFLHFKERVKFMNDEQFSKVYKEIEPFIIQRETDLNTQCMNQIPQDIKGTSVLEVGSGRGLLSIRLSRKYNVTASDIVRDKTLMKKWTNIKFRKAKAESLPFKNNSFDTVVSTHTLEHVLDLPKAISEIRRVAKKRIIIVVPKQRPYKYTFDLHLHFFSKPRIINGNNELQ